MSVVRPSLAELGLGHLFDLVPDPVVIGDVESGQIIAWNQAASRTFGYSHEAAIGMPLSALVPDELRKTHLAGLASYAAGGGGHLVGAADLIEVPAVASDGRRLWVELRLASLGEAAGIRRYVLALLRDVTSRREAQLQTAAALEAAHRANDALKDFVAMVSHDLRSPLTSVDLSFALLARHGDQLTPEQRAETLDTGRRQTAVMLSLLDDLLELSSIESGQLRTSPETLMLRPVLEAAAETAAVDVTIEASPDVLLYADPRHVQRAVVNLIVNAAKYGRPPIVVSGDDLGAAVELRVRDHGDGVPQDLRPRLFDRFSRADETAHSHPGVGLGLAIVAGLVHADQGSVSYEDAPDGGACFVLRWSTSQPG